jgi:hypothetical protein
VAVNGKTRYELEALGNENWQGFIALLMEAAFELGYRDLSTYYDDGPLKMEFVTQQNNKFYVFVLKDEFRISYARIFGPIKQLESEEEAVFFLIKNQAPWAKVYLDNDLFDDETWMAVLSQDTPVDGSYLSKPILLKSLEKLDDNLSLIKEEFEPPRENRAHPA